MEKLLHRHNQSGYFSLADLPQRPPITKHAISTGWWELDQILRFYPGQFVVCTGIAGHGKSTFLLNVLCNMAKSQAISSFLYVPENEAHISDKLRRIWKNDDTFEYFAQRQCFIQSALVDDHEQPPRDLTWVLNRAVTAVDHDAVRVVMVDPWNELERSKPRDMLMSDYIGECLMKIKHFCRLYNVTFFMVAHPTKAVNENGGRVPGLADIEGSMNWFNKCDNGLIVQRDKESNSCKIISAKVREIGAGKVGVCHFNVDPETGIFEPQYGAVT